MPTSPKLLPYDLVPVSKSHDVWKYASLVFDLHTGRFPFRLTDFGDLMNDSDYRRLSRWSSETAWDAVMETDEGCVEDPLARDLFHMLFASAGDRPTMEDVLDHAYFNNSEGDKFELNRMRTEIIRHEEAEVRKILETKRKTKRMSDWVSQRTMEVSGVMSVTAQLKFHQSAEMQWNSLCGAKDLKFPTCFSVLPYELHSDDRGKPMLSGDDEEVAKFIAVCLSDMVLFTEVTSRSANANPSDDQQVDKVTVSEFLNQEPIGMKHAASGVVSICERLATRAVSAEKILVGVLESLFEGSSPRAEEDASSLAKKLVSDAVEEYVDLQSCFDIVRKAREAERTFANLIVDIVEDSAQTAKSIVNDKLGSLIDAEFCNSLAAHAPQVDANLGYLVRGFTQDATEASKDLLSKKVKDLVHVFDSSEQTYFYHLDEFTGVPLVESVIPLDPTTASDVVRTLIPGFYLSLKSLCASNVVSGVCNAVGLELDQLDDAQLLRTSRCGLEGGFDDISRVNDFRAFLELIGVSSEELAKVEDFRQVASENLDIIEHFLAENDPTKQYAGLRRVKGPDGAVLWTSRKNEREISMGGSTALAEHARSLQMDASTALEGAMRARGILAEGESPRASIADSWRDASRTPTTIATTPGTTSTSGGRSFSTPTRNLHSLDENSPSIHAGGTGNNNDSTNNNKSKKQQLKPVSPESGGKKLSSSANTNNIPNKNNNNKPHKSMKHQPSPEDIGRNSVGVSGGGGGGGGGPSQVPPDNPSLLNDFEFSSTSAFEQRFHGPDVSSRLDPARDNGSFSTKNEDTHSFGESIGTASTTHGGDSDEMFIVQSGNAGNSMGFDHKPQNMLSKQQQHQQQVSGGKSGVVRSGLVSARSSMFNSSQNHPLAGGGGGGGGHHHSGGGGNKPTSPSGQFVIQASPKDIRRRKVRGLKKSGGVNEPEPSP